MLHIIGLIFKIIGIILLILLGLVLLLLLTVLFLPIRYTLHAQYTDGTPDIRMRLSWLLGLFRMRITFAGDFTAKAKILFLTVYDSGNLHEPRENIKKGHERKKKREPSCEKNVFDEEPPFSREATVLTEKEPLQDVQPEFQDTEQTGKTGRNAEKAETPEITGRLARLKAWFVCLLGRIRTFFATLVSAVRNFILGIVQAKDNFKEKISALLEKINDPQNRELVCFLWEQSKLLLKRFKPDKCRGFIHFGTDDVELTGKIAMYAAVLYGFMGLDIRVIPDFDHAVLEGELDIKGHIRLSGILVIALRVYRNRLFRKKILKKEK